jgi:hypothetical protein
VGDPGTGLAIVMQAFLSLGKKRSLPTTGPRIGLDQDIHIQADAKRAQALAGGGGGPWGRLGSAVSVSNPEQSSTNGRGRKSA